VVVVPAGDADSGGDSAPPAGPAYVTAGELDARLELLETRMADSISAAVATSWAAQAAAEEAQETALSAAVVAGEAAAAVDENVEAEHDAEDTEAVDESPRPPERRTAPAPVRRTSGGGASRPKAYGASWLSGRG
jgi:hypothetical protein